MTKVRADLLAVAQRVAALCPSDEPGTLVQTQIEAAIGLQARDKVFAEEDAAKLIQLRSQVFKSPHKKLRF